MPKRIHLKYKGMYMRSIIAILDNNNIVNKKKVEENWYFLNKPADVIKKKIRIK